VVVDSCKMLGMLFHHYLREDLFNHGENRDKFKHPFS